MSAILSAVSYYGCHGLTDRQDYSLYQYFNLVYIDIQLQDWGELAEKRLCMHDRKQHSFPATQSDLVKSTSLKNYSNAF